MRKYMMAGWLLLSLGNAALAVEELEDQSLTQIAGRDSVRLGTSETTLSSSAPASGDPIRSAKKKSTNEQLDKLDNTLENARQVTVKAPEAGDAPNIGGQNALPAGEYGFPKTIDTQSTHNAAPQHYSPGTFQQSNVKMEGSVKFSGGR